MVCEVPIMSLGVYSVLNTVVKWAKNIGVKEIIVLEGISIGVGDQDTVLKSDTSAMILSDNAETEDNKFLQHLNNKDTSNTKRALITGISGGLLATCLSNEIVCRGLVIPSSFNIPDPEGAAILFESVNRLGNEEPLRKWAANLKEELGEMSRAIQRHQQPSERQQGMYT